MNGGYINIQGLFFQVKDIIHISPIHEHFNLCDFTILVSGSPLPLHVSELNKNINVKVAYDRIVFLFEAYKDTLKDNIITIEI